MLSNSSVQLGALAAEHRDIAHRCGDGVGALAVDLAGPQVDPLVAGQVDLPLGLAALPHRSHQQVRAVEVLELLGIAAGVVLVVEEEGPHDRGALGGVFRHQRFGVGGQHGVDVHQTGQLLHAVLIVVILEIGVRAVALVGAHHGHEGGHLCPAEEDLLGAAVVEQRGVAADVAVVEAAAHHAGAEGRADDGAQAVVAAEVHALVTGPQQGAVLLAAGAAGPHEVDHLPQLAAFLYGVVVAFCPQHRPVVVLDHRADSVGKHQIVGGEILAKVCHPAVDADVQRILFDDLVLEPAVGLRVGEIHHAAVKLAKVHQIIGAVGLFGEDAPLFALGVELAVVDEVGVDVAQELDAPGVEFFNVLGQVRVHLLVVMPIPLEALAEAGHPLAAPVLAPQAGDLDAFFEALLHDAEAALVAALGADDEAVVDPLRQLRLAAQESSELFQQFHKGGRCLDADEARHVPALQLVVVGVAEIEIAVSGGVHVEVVAAAGNVGRLRVVGVVIITARAAVFHVAAPGHIGGLVAADARLTGPQGEVTAPQIRSSSSARRSRRRARPRLLPPEARSG